MVICSCNIISSTAIKQAVEKLYEEENLTPKKILNEIGWKPDCCSCVNELVELIMQEKKRLTDKGL